MPLFLIRHGESTYNKMGLAQGHSQNSTLTEKGKEQIRKLAKKLSLQTFDEIHASDLKRVLESLNILKEFILCPTIQISESLREKDQGGLTGLAYKSKEWLKYQSLLSEGANDYSQFSPTPEDPASFRKRIVDYLDKLDHSKNILVLTHAGVIRNYIAHSKGISLKDYLQKHRTLVQIENGSVIEIKPT